MSLSQDMMKYLTVKIVKSFDKPPEEPVKKKKEQKPSWSEQWFGVLPLTIKTLTAKEKPTIKEKKKI
ncbi:MAG TPA: YqzE family protein [Paenibacillaceae bacterium]|nr:YqzE family protein [Paenibacillaceae bacterium]